MPATVAHHVQARQGSRALRRCPPCHSFARPSFWPPPRFAAGPARSGREGRTRSATRPADRAGPRRRRGVGVAVAAAQRIGVRGAEGDAGGADVVERVPYPWRRRRPHDAGAGRDRRAAGVLEQGGRARRVADAGGYKGRASPGWPWKKSSNASSTATDLAAPGNEILAATRSAG